MQRRRCGVGGHRWQRGDLEPDSWVGFAYVGDDYGQSDGDNHIHSYDFDPSRVPRRRGSHHQRDPIRARRSDVSDDLLVCRPRGVFRSFGRGQLRVDARRAGNQSVQPKSLHFPVSKHHLLRFHFQCVWRGDGQCLGGTGGADGFGHRWGVDVPRRDHGTEFIGCGFLHVVAGGLGG